MLAPAHPLVKCAFILSADAAALAGARPPPKLEDMLRRILPFLALFTLAYPLWAADLLATLRPGHPRLLLTDQQLAAAVAAAKLDPLRAQLHERIIALARAELNAQPIEHRLIGPRLARPIAAGGGPGADVLACVPTRRVSGRSPRAPRRRC
jgi:hypothetical protein